MKGRRQVAEALVKGPTKGKARSVDLFIFSCCIKIIIVSISLESF